MPPILIEITPATVYHIIANKNETPVLKHTNTPLMKRLFFATILALSALFAQAQSQYRVTHIDSVINTVGYETGAIVVDDSILLYTAMTVPEQHHLYLIDFAPILSQVCQAPILPDGSLGAGTPNNWGINSNGNSNGNIAFDAKNDIIYFTREASSNSGINQIYYTKRTNRRWGKPQPLGGDVNLKGCNSTHPAIGYMPDGKPILFLSSDRPGGLGGMDIWYALIISDGKPGNCTNLGAPVNSDSNEVTPYYCDEEGALYFSSNREGGQGGFDVYSSLGQRNSWQQPEPLGDQVNTPYDDLFFTFQPCRCRCAIDSTDTAVLVEACGFLASNRPGSLYSTNEGCCNDLFRWQRIRPKPTAPAPALPDTPLHALDLLPLSLYFHNDEPDAHTLDTVTKLDYTAAWTHYMHLRNEYCGAQPSPADKRKWDSVQKGVGYFFDNELEQGHSNLLQFLQLLLRDLRNGQRITLTVDGYASPLFEDCYNVNLSKRRIDCFRNTLLRWNSEALKPYLADGSLILETAAHGAADTAAVIPSDPRRDPKSPRSVYSLEAARDRRIDICGHVRQ